MYSFVNTTNSNKDGTIGFDIAGKLVGDWVAKTATNAFSSTSTQLSLVYDTRTVNTMHISSGGTGIPVGDYGVSLSDPDFATISVSSGVVTYHLTGQNNAPSGALLVQLTDSSTLKLEFFSGSSGGTFDRSAATFVR